MTIVSIVEVVSIIGIVSIYRFNIIYNKVRAMATFGVVRSDSDYDIDTISINSKLEKRSSSSMRETDSNPSWKLGAEIEAVIVCNERYGFQSELEIG